MPLIISDRNEFNTSPLIVNGRKLNGINENKTIWSYKPDDRRVKVEFLLLLSLCFYIEIFNKKLFYYFIMQILIYNSTIY